MLLEPNGWISSDVTISSARGEGVLFKVRKKDRWAFSAKLPLAYRLVWHYRFLDDTRRVRQNFHAHREAHRPQISFQGRIQYLDPPPTAARSINLVGLFLAESLCILSLCQCGLKLIANSTNALCWLADAPILETFIHAVSYTRVEPLQFPTGGYFVVEPQGLFHLNPGPLLALTLFHANYFLSGMPVD